MQEIKKRRIVIVSVLKPIDDSRMFEKFALTLGEFYEVYILGFPSVRKPPEHGNVHVHQSLAFRRISFKRLLAPWRHLRTIMKLRPHDLIITTHEMLLPALLVKLFTHSRIWYDVQENYFRNILYMDTFPKVIRPLLALYVRLKEILLAPIIHHYLLAERIYYNELPFVRNKSTILENKYKHPDTLPRIIPRKQRGLSLLFSGTLSASTGVFTAVQLANALHQVDSSVRLVIVGYCARSTELDQLKSAIAGKDHITLIGGPGLVPHDEIVAQIRDAGFGIIAYPPGPASAGRIPTKLFEYLAHELPVLCIDHPLWTEHLRSYEAVITFQHPVQDPHALIAQMKTGTFYSRKPTGVTWDDEGRRLIRLFGKP